MEPAEIGKSGVLLTNNNDSRERAQSPQRKIGRTAGLPTNTNAIRDFQKADIANRGGFATDHPNGLCDADEDVSSQVYVPEELRIVPNPPGKTVDGKGVAKPGRDSRGKPLYSMIMWSSKGRRVVATATRISTSSGPPRITDWRCSPTRRLSPTPVLAVARTTFPASVVRAEDNIVDELQTTTMDG